MVLKTGLIYLKHFVFTIIIILLNGVSQYQMDPIIDI